MCLSSIVGYTWGWFPSPSRSPTSRRIQRWQKQLGIILVVQQPSPSLVSFGSGVQANLLWVKLPPRNLHQRCQNYWTWANTAFFSWTPNLYILSRLPEAFLLCCRQKSNTSWAMEEVTCSQSEVATWDHWFLFLSAFWLARAELLTVLGSAFTPAFLTSVFISPSKSKWIYCWRELSAKDKPKADARDCSARHLLTLIFSCEKQQSGCLLHLTK